MVRRIFSLALALQLLLPAHAVQDLFAAGVPAPAADTAPQPEPKLCPCTGKVGCNCCGCSDEPEPPTDSVQPDKPDNNPGPHGCLHCRCKIAESMAAANVYLPERGPMFRTLCQPRHEDLHAESVRYPSPALPIDSPPPKDQA